jgi:hypothetical protein
MVFLCESPYTYLPIFVQYNTQCIRNKTIYIISRSYGHDHFTHVIYVGQRDVVINLDTASVYVTRQINEIRGDMNTKVAH